LNLKNGFRLLPKVKLSQWILLKGKGHIISLDGNSFSFANRIGCLLGVEFALTTLESLIITF